MLPVDGILEFQCEHPIASSSRGFVGIASESHSANSIIDSTTDRNRMDDVAENGIAREEEIVIEASIAREACDRLAENDCAMPVSVHSDGCCEIKEASRHDDSSNSSDDDVSSPRCDVQMEEISDQPVKDSVVSKSSSFEGQQHVQAGGDDDQERVISSCAELEIESTSASVHENRVDETNVAMRSHDVDVKTVVSLENNILDDSKTMTQSKSNAKAGSRRKRELLGLQLEDQFHASGFIRSPCEGLRPRAREDSSACVTNNRELVEEAPVVKKSRKAADQPVPSKDKKEKPKELHKCDFDGCKMSFRTKAKLLLHKGNQCPVDGCRKKFSSHKYAIRHQRVHNDDRPLKCPWDGCKMSFKWDWARTEHLRVHTGERPYSCKVKGCGLTFRFVSDISRHRRKTGHYGSPHA